MIIINSGSAMLIHSELVNSIMNPLYDGFGGQLKKYTPTIIDKQKNRDGFVFHCEFTEEPAQILNFKTQFTLYSEGKNVDEIVLVTPLSESKYSKRDNYTGLNEQLLSDITAILEKEFRINTDSSQN